MTQAAILGLIFREDNKMKVVITARDFTSSEVDGGYILKNNNYEIVDYSNEHYISKMEVSDLIGDADAVITGLEPVGAEVFEKCTNLKLISRRGIGYDSIDIEACRRYNVALARTTGVVEAAVAEHCMAYILGWARQIATQNEWMHNSQWKRIMMPGAKNRVLGLVGFGGIGREIAKRAVPFGMKVIYYCRHPRKEWDLQYGVQYCELDRLLECSDYLSINVPLTDETRGMFGEKQFHRMKKNAVLINTAREPIVDYYALARALETEQIGGACVDVFQCEPCVDSPLLKCKNAILTPHTAPYTSENFKLMNERAAQNVVDYFNHELNDIYRVT